MNQTEQWSDYKKLLEPECQHIATRRIGKKKVKPEHTTEEFQDSSMDNNRRFLKKAFDFSFVQAALYLTEAVHKQWCAHFMWHHKMTLHSQLTL